jgi:hypothetical protein
MRVHTLQATEVVCAANRGQQKALSLYNSELTNVCSYLLDLLLPMGPV